MKTVLITGVAGFLGHYVSRHFSKCGWRVVGLDDVAPENAPLGPNGTYIRLRLPSTELDGVIRTVAPDACVHCAGRASVPFSMQDPASDFRDNTVLTFELLDALRRTAPRCCTLFLSSAAVYGNPESLPIGETHRTAPLSPYGYHKLQCELLCQEYSTIHGLPTASVRIFSAYGPGLRRQVVWDVCERALTVETLTLRGTGRESRDFIHAGDIARALVLLAEKAPATGEIYNLASGREVTVAELARLLVGSLGLKIEAQFDGTVRAGDPLNWRADISKIAALGFASEIALEDGLRDVAQWSRIELGRS